MNPQQQVEATVEPADGVAGRKMLGAMEVELDELYRERPGSLTSLPVAPADFEPPGGAFVVLRSGEEALACGGVKRAADTDGTCGEIKRMYVEPSARGRGLSRRLLSELEEQARRLGYSEVRLDTGPDQPAARHLYESAGYRAVPAFNDNPYAAHWFVKELG